MKSFVSFIGHPRSGHSIIGALIDAHPNAIVPHEYGAIQKYQKKWHTCDELFIGLQQQSAHDAANSHLRNPRSGAYHVPGQWQGTHNGLAVIGDKHGGATAVAIGTNPSVLDVIYNEIQLPIKFIHVYRHPYDNIATIKNRHEFSLEKVVSFYFNVCNCIDTTLDKINSAPQYSVLTIKQEEFVDTTVAHLHRICDYLELPPNLGYFQACSGIVFKSPRVTRDTVTWTESLKDIVRERAQRHPYLSSYNYA